MAQPFTPRNQNSKRPPIERGPIQNLNIPAMWAPIPGTNERAKFLFSTQDGNPRATVFYNTTEKQRPINIHMKAIDLKIIIMKLRELLAEGKPFVLVIGNLMPDYVEGKMSGKTKISEWYIGMEDDGTFWTGLKDLVAPRQTVKFNFLIEDWHDINVRQNGETRQMSKAESSKLAFVCTLGLLDDYFGVFARGGIHVDDGNSLDAAVTNMMSPSDHGDTTLKGGPSMATEMSVKKMESAMPDFDDIAM